ncbi:MAG: hypothetical protein HY872_01215 [Chloroflexi bacterium]|nr:hypothetical protein [Chloroflexota bacterium]
MTQFVARLYALLLHLYPLSFRAEYGEEMQAVFAEAMAEAAERGVAAFIAVCLGEIRDMPGSLLREHLSMPNDRKDKADMSDSIERLGNLEARPAARGTDTWKGALVGALPFLVFGAASMVTKDRSLLFHGGYPFLAFYIFSLLGLGAGWVKGFPRWSYAYLWWALVFAWWWTTMWTDGLNILGYTFHEAWGWRIWLPLAAAIVIALLMTRSLRPLRQLVTGFWQDWTRVSLGGFVLLAWLTLVADENHNPYLLILMTASTLAFAGSAWAYMRAAQAWQRALALMVGIGLSAVVGAIDNATWDWRAYYGVPAPSGVSPYAETLRAVVVLAFWAAILFSPALIGLLRRTIDSRRAA